MSAGNEPNDLKQDPSLLGTIYKDPYKIFSFQPASPTEAVQDCVFVLDTNVLLIPFNTGKQPLEDIRTIYKRLAAEGRLAIPAQVAREFASNRPSQLTNVFHQLNSKCEKLDLKPAKYPLLESLPEYQAMLKAEAKAQEAIKELQAAVKNVLAIMREWRWNDPVSSLYREVFDGSTVVQLPTTEEDLAKEAKDRFSRQIPPGYKDASKKANPFGDFVIWKTILEIGLKRKKHVIFVSGDEKADWWHQANNEGLYPRHELVEEFRRVTDGKSFHIFKFPDFLKYQGADEGTVSKIEEQMRLPVSFLGEQAALPEYMEAAVLEWFCKTYGQENVRTTFNESSEFYRQCYNFIVSKPSGSMGVRVFPPGQVDQLTLLNLVKILPPEIREVCLFFIAQPGEDELMLSTLAKDSMSYGPHISACVGAFSADGRLSVQTY